MRHKWPKAGLKLNCEIYSLTGAMGNKYNKYNNNIHSLHVIVPTYRMNNWQLCEYGDSIVQSIFTIIQEQAIIIILINIVTI